MMGARLERDVSRRATRELSGFAQRVHFRVRFSGTGMPTFTDDTAIAHEHATDPWVRHGRVKAALRQLERAGHVLTIGFSEHPKGHCEERSAEAISKRS